MSRSFAPRALFALAIVSPLIVGQVMPAVAADAAQKSDPPRGSEAIQKSLDQKVSLEFVETSLADITEELIKRHTINVQFDKKALEDAGVQSDQQITVKFKDITLRSALRHLLSPLELTYVVENDVLLITTPEREQATVSARVYSAPEIIANKGIHKNVTPPGDQLIKLIENVLSPTSWSTFGGVGTASYVGNTLVIGQTEKVHQDIDPLLTALRSSLNNIDQPEILSIATPNLRDARVRIEKALATTVSLEFVETPFAEITEHLEERYGLPVRMDVKAFEDAGVQSDQQLTFRVKNVPLAAALSRLLAELNLDYVIRDELLIVTTSEVADATLDVRVYSGNRPLLAGATNDDEAWAQTHQTSAYPTSAKKPPSPDWHASMYRRVVEGIVKNVDPQSWDEAGGVGRLSVYEPGHCLVIAQTRRGHEKIANLLVQLRDAAKNAPARAK